MKLEAKAESGSVGEVPVHVEMEDVISQTLMKTRIWEKCTVPETHSTFRDIHMRAGRQVPFALACISLESPYPQLETVYLHPPTFSPRYHVAECLRFLPLEKKKQL